MEWNGERKGMEWNGEKKGNGMEKGRILLINANAAPFEAPFAAPFEAILSSRNILLQSSLS